MQDILMTFDSQVKFTDGMRSCVAMRRNLSHPCGNVVFLIDRDAVGRKTIAPTGRRIRHDSIEVSCSNCWGERNYACISHGERAGDFSG